MIPEHLRKAVGIDAKTAMDNLNKAFTKRDSMKPNIAILFDTPKALTEVTKVLEYGANKYSRKNWALVDDIERYESASLRHKMSRLAGWDIDDESGLQHLAHEIASLLFILELKLGEDK